MILARVSLMCLSGLLLVLASSSHAAEVTCDALGSNCICSEPFNTDKLVRIGSSYYNPVDSGAKECTAEGDMGNAIVRNSNDIVASNDPAAIAALPNGHKIKFFPRGPAGHVGIFFAGGKLGSAFAERGAARWYIYHSLDFEFANEGQCGNSKMAAFDGGLLLDKSFGFVHMYNFTTWAPAQDCCLSGPGPQNVGKQDWRGKWWRVEVVFSHRAGGNPGFVAKVYMQNVTDKTPEILVVDTSMSGSQLVPSVTRTPPQRMDSMAMNNYRQGTCNGWLGFSHYMLAGWDTDNGQRIGPAVEIEGGSLGDRTAPLEPKNLRIQ